MTLKSLSNERNIKNCNALYRQLVGPITPYSRVYDSGRMSKKDLQEQLKEVDFVISYLFKMVESKNENIMNEIYNVKELVSDSMTMASDSIEETKNLQDNNTELATTIFNLIEDNHKLSDIVFSELCLKKFKEIIEPQIQYPVTLHIYKEGAVVYYKLDETALFPIREFKFKRVEELYNEIFLDEYFVANRRQDIENAKKQIGR